MTDPKKTYVTLLPSELQAISVTMFNSELHSLFTEDFAKSARRVIRVADALRLHTEKAKTAKFNEMKADQQGDFVKPAPLTQVEYFLKAMEKVLFEIEQLRDAEFMQSLEEPPRKKPTK